MTSVGLEAAQKQQKYLFGSAMLCKRAARFGVCLRLLAPERRLIRSGRRPRPFRWQYQRELAEALVLWALAAPIGSTQDVIRKSLYRMPSDGTGQGGLPLVTLGDDGWQLPWRLRWRERRRLPRTFALTDCHENGVTRRNNSANRPDNQCHSAKETVPAIFGATQLLAEATNPHQSRQVSWPLVSTGTPAIWAWRTRHYT